MDGLEYNDYYIIDEVNMADKNNKVSGNVPGRYYVDTNCIGCNLCVETEPGVFKMNKEDQAYVYKQPSGQEEEEASKAALDSCPVEAIGEDGE